jgi:RNA 3'-terminal phosphate cyclase (ATP)
MADHVSERLTAVGIDADVVAERVQAACPGAALFLVVDHRQGRAGFSALGRRGKPAEAAVQALIRDLRSGAALDEHLGD